MELKYTGSSHLNAVSSNTVILGNLCLDTRQFTNAGFSHKIVVNTLIVNMDYIRHVQFVNKNTDKNNVNNQSYNYHTFMGKPDVIAGQEHHGIPLTLCSFHHTTRFFQVPSYH